MAAITARLGTDLGPLQKGLEKGRALAVATSRQVADDAKKATKEAEAAQVALTKRREDMAKRANASLSTVASGLQSAGNAGDLIVSGFEAIGALSAPVAGVAVGVGLIAKGMWDSRESARQMNREFDELARRSKGKSAMSAGAGDLIGDAGGVSEMLRQRQLAKDDMAAKYGDWTKDTNASSLVGALWEKAGGINGVGAAAIGVPQGTFGAGSNEKGKADSRAAEAMKERYRLWTQAAAREEADLELARQKLTVSEADAALAEIELRTKREIAEITRELEQQKAGPETIEAVTAPIAERGRLEKQQASLQIEAAKRTIGLEQQIQDIRAGGDNSAVASAERRQYVAGQELAAAKTTEQIESAKAKLSAASTDLTEAQRAREVLLANLDAQKEAAAFVGTEDERHTNALDVQGRLIAKLMEGAKPDEKLALGGQLAENEAAKRENVRGLAGKAVERAFALSTTGVEAGQGVGDAEAQRALEDKRGAAQTHLANLQMGIQTDESPQQIAAAKASINQMTNALDEMRDARERNLRSAKDESDILAAQTAGHSMLAKKLQIEASFRDKIHQAERNGNTGLKQELEGQQAQQLAAIDREMSPAQRRAQARAETRARKLGDRNQRANEAIRNDRERTAKANAGALAGLTTSGLKSGDLTQRPNTSTKVQGGAIGDAIGKAAIAALENATIVIRNVA